MKERLQKILAAAGVTSRRRAEGLIEAGLVTVNGRVAVLGESADASVDRIEVRGDPVRHSPGRLYLALNKPVGYVTTARSTHGEKTVLELVDVDERVFPVGRLDRDTSGLLLLTNDGEWADLVTHPRYGVEKEYEVTIAGHPSPVSLRALRDGVLLPDGTVTAPAQVELLQRRSLDSVLRITVVEGKKRQIRLMVGAVGHPAIALRRVRVGGISLGDLPAGRWRHLVSKEVKSVRETGRGTTVAAVPGSGAAHRDRRTGRRG
jgi:pseudouridine synthase